MTSDPDEDNARGILRGRAWAENTRNTEALAEVETFDWSQEPTYAQAFILYMHCIDPEGDLTADDILQSEAILTSGYLIGFIVGAQSAIAAMKQRPN